uniref:Zinc finger protein 62-like n=1 Tax=Saccoglossus kowalevskii TaxID=10224 RepID=A0ABM0M1D3_SACKO|nr:PREDICTED: zinc finger protein 62-like [Saccoglossus kowalevskii]
MGKKDNNEQKRQNRNLKVVNKDEKSDRETSSIMVLRPSPSPRAKLIGTITEPSKRRTRQTQKTSSSALIKKVFQRTPYNNIVVDFAYGKYLAAYKSAFPGVSLPSIADFGRRIRSVESKKNDGEADSSTKTNEETSLLSYQCNLCGVIYTHRSDVNKHMVMHKKRLEDSRVLVIGHEYECKVCGISYMLKKYMQDCHICDISADSYNCKFCGSTYANERQLGKHLKKHTAKKSSVSVSTDYVERDDTALEMDKPVTAFYSSCRDESSPQSNSADTEFNTTHEYELGLHKHMINLNPDFQTGATSGTTYQVESEIQEKMNECILKTDIQFTSTYTNELENEISSVVVTKNEISPVVVTENKMSPLDFTENEISPVVVAENEISSVVINRPDYEYVESDEFVSEVESYPCEYCRKLLSSRFRRASHQQRHIVGDKFKCLYCRQLFDDKASLVSHSLASHHNCYPLGGLLIHKCKQCSARFNKKEYLTIHMLTHTGQGLIKCEVCNKLFTNKNALDSHITSKHSSKFGKCLRCNKYVLLCGLDKHMASHMSEKEENSYVCGRCEETFTEQRQLESHLCKMTDVVSRFVVTYNCVECGEQFVSSEVPDNTMPLTCDKCKVMSQYTSLKTRKILKRSGWCTSCNCFIPFVFLKSHMKICSQKASMYLCDNCGFLFKSLLLLEKHKLVCNQQNTGHPCERCGSDHLSYLCRMALCKPGNDNRSFCENCGEMFASSLSEIHKTPKILPFTGGVRLQCDVNEKPYSCVQCGVSYAEVVLLQIHMEAHAAESQPQRISVKSYNELCREQFELQRMKLAVNNKVEEIFDVQSNTHLKIIRKSNQELGTYQMQFTFT